MGKHTPGPWIAVEEKDWDKLKVWSIEHEHIDSDDVCWICDVYVEANAHLISAAPDLLDALKDVMAWIDNWDPSFTDDDEWDDTDNKVDVAIAKAEGNS